MYNTYRTRESDEGSFREDLAKEDGLAPSFREDLRSRKMYNTYRTRESVIHDVCL